MTILERVSSPMDNTSNGTPSPLKELLSQVELPRTTSQCAPGSTLSDWEQIQFWDQFLRSSSPQQLVTSMKLKMYELGLFDMLNDDDYNSIAGAVSRYQASPMGDLHRSWEGQDTYALSTLLLSERASLEGLWELQIRRKSLKGRSSATKYLWEESAVQLRRRRVSSQSNMQVTTAFAPRNGTPVVEQRRVTVAYTAGVQTTPESSHTASSHHPPTRDCYFIVLLAFLVVTGSTAVGMYFSIAEDRMSDGFTVASYILAAGTLILGPWVAMHYQKCTCRMPWPFQVNVLGSDESGIELVPLTRSPTIDTMY